MRDRWAQTSVITITMTGAPVEIAAVVLFGSVALWLAESLTAR